MALGLGLGCGALAVVLALGLAADDRATVPESPAGQQLAAAERTSAKSSSRSKASGGGFKPRRAKFQKTGSKNKIKPTPQGKIPRDDRGAIWNRGCMIMPPQTRSKPCVFGKRRAKRTVVLFGDSHALDKFGAVNRLAKRRGFRLVAQTKAGCGPNDQTVYNHKIGGEYRQCHRWHRNVLKRINRIEPELILTGIAVLHKPMRNGEIMEGKRARQALERGYVSMLDKLRATDARVVAFKDHPKAPRDNTDCVKNNLNDLGKCAFRKGRNFHQSWEAQAVRSVPGVKLINLTPGMCRKRRCFGVTHNKMVYRDDDHMTATFARSLAPWLARELSRRR